MGWLKQVITWLMPHGLYRLWTQLLPTLVAKRTRLKRPLQLAALNRNLKNRHSGQRCFIVANGPSINTQDLLPLKDELVFSVSSGYHYKNYLQIQPKYHCVPQITYGKVTTNDTIAWFQEMHDKIGSAELFLNYTEEPLVQEHGLYTGRQPHYLCLNDSFDQHSGDRIIDITDTVPRVQSAPIMCLMIAMYMGFREIYLLGTEHDHFSTRRYDYFYKPTVLAGMDSSVDEQGRLLIDRFTEFSGLLTLWSQYRRINEIANSNDITIYNATSGGELDVFPRIALADVLSGRVRN